MASVVSDKSSAVNSFSPIVDAALRDHLAIEPVVAPAGAPVVDMLLESVLRKRKRKMRKHKRRKRPTLRPPHASVFLTNAHPLDVFLAKAAILLRHDLLDLTTIASAAEAIFLAPGVFALVVAPLLDPPLAHSLHLVLARLGATPSPHALAAALNLSDVVPSPPRPPSSPHSLASAAECLPDDCLLARWGLRELATGLVARLEHTDMTGDADDVAVAWLTHLLATAYAEEPTLIMASRLFEAAADEIMAILAMLPAPIFTPLELAAAIVSVPAARYPDLLSSHSQAFLYSGGMDAITAALAAALAAFPNSPHAVIRLDPDRDYMETAYVTTDMEVAPPCEATTTLIALLTLNPSAPAGDLDPAIIADALAAARRAAPRLLRIFLVIDITIETPALMLPRVVCALDLGGTQCHLLLCKSYVKYASLGLAKSMAGSVVATSLTSSTLPPQLCELLAAWQADASLPEHGLLGLLLSYASHRELELVDSAAAGAAAVAFAMGPLSHTRHGSGHAPTVDLAALTAKLAFEDRDSFSSLSSATLSMTSQFRFNVGQESDDELVLRYAALGIVCRPQLPGARPQEITLTAALHAAAAAIDDGNPLIALSLYNFIFAHHPGLPRHVLPELTHGLAAAFDILSAEALRFEAVHAVVLGWLANIAVASDAACAALATELTPLVPIPQSIASAMLDALTSHHRHADGVLGARARLVAQLADMPDGALPPPLVDAIRASEAAAAAKATAAAVATAAIHRVLDAALGEPWRLQ
ncbi:uncharacterized protein AMSG_12295 [Thecamonas trahens ATCC 50062]|uniref:Uncharacterized protein n=1 Tax=Thecamonas trahens ATCC 50062 TaxID=461836 RepID=A0A0L0DNQ4_THETB|nr:hypothetical protein AMSG_12295 [Thecamonas trahens ATCC 50062]KNC53895.1 hypothetical protein AMSG_12295 [Thecamonas trahens ATCC 50062]|eukprot:XP_013754288.1 hypothetical protein AMSG_12295 [Thecamonas trahens ATCC 50062]